MGGGGWPPGTTGDTDDRGIGRGLLWVGGDSRLGRQAIRTMRFWIGSASQTNGLQDVPKVHEFGASHTVRRRDGFGDVLNK